MKTDLELFEKLYPLIAVILLFIVGFISGFISGSSYEHSQKEILYFQPIMNCSGQLTYYEDNGTYWIELPNHQVAKVSVELPKQTCPSYAGNIPENATVDCVDNNTLNVEKWNTARKRFVLGCACTRNLNGSEWNCSGNTDCIEKIKQRR